MWRIGIVKNRFCYIKKEQFDFYVCREKYCKLGKGVEVRFGFGAVKLNFFYFVECEVE